MTSVIRLAEAAAAVTVCIIAFRSALGCQFPTRLPGAPRVSILNFQRLLKTRRKRVTETRDQQEVAEQLALVLTTHGLQRMTARVLATLLFTEQQTMTMGELADRLQASAGAISGAIKMLTSVGLVERVPAPAQPPGPLPPTRRRVGGVVHEPERGDPSDAGRCRGRHRGRSDGDSLARRRLTQMRDFYAFLLAEIPALLDRWRRRIDSGSVVDHDDRITGEGDWQPHRWSISPESLIVSPAADEPLVRSTECENMGVSFGLTAGYPTSISWGSRLARVRGGCRCGAV